MSISIKGSVWFSNKGGGKFGIVYGMEEYQQGKEKKIRRVAKVGSPQPMTSKEDNAAYIAEQGADVTKENLVEVLGFLDVPAEAGPAAEAPTS